MSILVILVIFGYILVYKVIPGYIRYIYKIFNTHFTGSPLWNLFSDEAVQLESSYNTSVKVMFDLPYDTHRCLIEPITESRHVRIILMKRFLNFIEQIRKSSKQLPKKMLSIIRRDVRSTTGSNLRQILLQTKKAHVEHLKSSDIMEIKYHPIKEEDKWKTGVIYIKSLRCDEVMK